MAVQFSVAARNAALDALEAAVGASAILKFYDLTAGAPANCAASITGAVLATLNLPSDWMAAASGGVKSLAGSWADNAADATGVADFYRIFASDGVTCHEQGTVTATGGGGDMTVDNTSFAAGQPVTVTSKTWTAGGA